MADLRLQGTLTALVTPFTPDGDAVDLAALDALVEAQIAGGISGLVPCGTTGEAPTLSDEEQAAVIKRVAQAAAGRVPVIAGTGSFSTKKSIAASKAALAAGADGVMIVMPYYNKPSQDGMREHVLAIARSVPCPIVLYNIPGRSVVDLSVEATEKICQGAPNVVAIKDATGNVLRCQELKRRLGDRLTVLSGDDALTLPMMASGASGVIVTSNVRPRETSAVTSLALAGDYPRARAAHLALLELHGAMFVEPNPAPAKAALASLGKMSAAVRLPLVPAGEATRRLVEGALGRLEAAFPKDAFTAARYSAMKIAVHGATGRMGQCVTRLAATEGATIVGAVASPHSKGVGRDVGDVAAAGHLGVEITADTASALLGADVVIDFSRPEALPHLLQLAARAKVAVVSGTTRLDATCERVLDEVARAIPVLWAPNTSLGVQVLAEVVALAVKKLGLGFDVEIVEAHHRAKIDAPSGTAQRLRAAVEEAREVAPVYGREGNVGPRKAEEIGVLAIRGGDVIGDHTVHLLGPGERLELTHRATNRDLFARGALRAARFVAGRAPGRYSMADVLGAD